MSVEDKVLIELEVSLEGKLEVVGREVFKADLVGRPTFVTLPPGDETTLKAVLSYAFAKGKAIVESAPKDANAYLAGKPNNKILPIQYYKLHHPPRGPGFD